jgi:AcrR family transcriptional regulator
MRVSYERMNEEARGDSAGGNEARGQRRASPGTEAGTRTDLLAAARECVRTHGLAGTTSRLIANAAGANLGAITYYFGSKDELVAEALFGELERRLGPVLELLEQERPAPERLIEAVRGLTVEFERSVDDVPVYLNALLLGTEAGPLGERARRLLATLRTRLVAVIADLRDAGVVAGWVSPDAMATLLVAAGNGIALQTRLEPGTAVVGELAGQLAHLLLAASTPGNQ